MRKLVPGSRPAFAATSLSVISSSSAVKASISRKPLASDWTVLRSPAEAAVLRFAVLVAAVRTLGTRQSPFRIAKNISHFLTGGVLRRVTAVNFAAAQKRRFDLSSPPD